MPHEWAVVRLTSQMPLQKPLKTTAEPEIKDWMQAAGSVARVRCTALEARAHVRGGDYDRLEQVQVQHPTQTEAP